MSRKRKNIPQAISKKDFQKIALAIYTLSPSKFLRARNLLMCIMCYTAGFRPKEVYNAKLEHLNLSERTLYIPAENNKQRNQDYAPLPNSLIEPLKKYLAVRPDSIWLFPSAGKTGHICRSSFAKFFRDALKKSKLYQVSYIKKNNGKELKMSVYNVYSLRHSFGVNTMDKLHDPRKVALLLRHYDEQLRSVWVYIHTLSKNKRKGIMDSLETNSEG